jgi:hypothetical protein
MSWASSVATTTMSSSPVAAAPTSAWSIDI